MTLFGIAGGMRAGWLLFSFFFSSRRRHTRFDCDWSSDVCSSDLLLGQDGIDVEAASPFETGDPRQPRNDLQVPVIVRDLFGIEGGRVNNVIVRRVVQG